MLPALSVISFATPTGSVRTSSPRELCRDCSTAGLNPRRDAMNESPLKIALFSLVKMSAYLLCRQFIRSSELFPFIGQLRQSPESNIANYASFITTKAES
ncbi:hypothetical protein OROMI_033072 [Orobanche minor]